MCKTINGCEVSELSTSSGKKILVEVDLSRIKNAKSDIEKIDKFIRSVNKVYGVIQNKDEEQNKIWICYKVRPEQ